MNIIEATKKAMQEGRGIARPCLKKAVYLPPTNTYECYITIPVGMSIKGFKSNERRAAPRWNPKAADILADDWEVTEEIL